jgi:hypothetical protein
MNTFNTITDSLIAKIEEFKKKKKNDLNQSFDKEYEKDRNPILTEIVDYPLVNMDFASLYPVPIVADRGFVDDDQIFLMRIEKGLSQLKTIINSSKDLRMCSKKLRQDEIEKIENAILILEDLKIRKTYDEDEINKSFNI